ncbi:MAG TPA: DNA topoisomerase IB [Acetobacteraceae bacterium]|nr:DNA topoisomerase IB [Acetobacteraceae bacterium]
MTNPAPLDDARFAAKVAHLRYVSDDRPGFTRKSDGKGGWRYYDTEGKRITDKAILARIRSLGIPPAYRDVWICPLENGHLQATGRDARGRKQYRYHPRWREVRDAAKYHRMLAFGAMLPAIRRRVEADLARPGLPREKVMATIVYLLEKTCIRIGNDEYAQSNRSYGLTTLLNEHVHISGSRLRFRFRGKSGKEHDIALHDAAAARILRKCQELPGHELFEYVDQDGVTHRVHSGDVNDYLREISEGEEFTAKDFRTWAGTLFCAACLAAGEAATSQSHAKHLVAEAIRQVSQRLGNTPAVCRKCYVHPAVIEAFQEGAMILEREAEAAADEFALNPEEAAMLRFLERRARGAGRLK